MGIKQKLIVMHNAFCITVLELYFFAFVFDPKVCGGYANQRMVGDIDAKENVCDPMYIDNSDLLLLIKSF